MWEGETSIVNATSSGQLGCTCGLTRQVLVLLPICSLGQFSNSSAWQDIEIEREKVTLEKLPLPLWEKVARTNSVPDEGLRSIDRPQPLTRLEFAALIRATLSHKGREEN